MTNGKITRPLRRLSDTFRSVLVVVSFLITGFHSKLRLPSRGRENVFDLSPKERLEMLTEVEKYTSKQNSRRNSKKLRLPNRGEGKSRIFIPPEVNRDKGTDVYILFAICAFLLCFCLPTLIQKTLSPKLLGDELKEMVDIVTKNEVKFG